MKRNTAAPLVASFGGTIFLVAAVHHARELGTLDGSLGPLLAFLLDSVPALGLVYGGYFLSRTDFSADDRWRVTGWCLSGAAVFVTVIGATLLIRAFEGRPIGEPVFSVLVAVEIGGIAGFVAGFYNTRAAVDARRARRATSGLKMVNGVIRHDLRNDLASIRAYAELIDAESESPGNATEIIRKASEATQRIEDAGALGKTITGDGEFETVDLVTLTREIVSQVRDTRCVTIRTDLPDSAEVRANAAIRSVLDNLVENAVEHTDSKDPVVAVTVETDAETVRWYVHDDGPGIPDERKESVFAYREDGTGGGGLFLVDTLVSEYGGDVWIEDNEPSGATVVVELPRAEGESSGRQR